jgi:hypothetical protein
MRRPHTFGGLKKGGGFPYQQWLVGAGLGTSGAVLRSPTPSTSTRTRNQTFLGFVRLPTSSSTIGTGSSFAWVNVRSTRYRNRLTGDGDSRIRAFRLAPGVPNRRVI